MIKTHYLTLLLLLFCSGSLLAQSVPKWGGGADEADWSFGFSFSGVSSYYKIDKTLNWQTPFIDPVNNVAVTSPLTSISSSYVQGFAVGFLRRYRVTEHLELRTTPSIIFTDRMLSYTFVSDAPINKTISSTAFDFPISVKLKSDRIGDYRGYLIAGVKYTETLGQKLNSDADAAPLDKLVRNVGSYGSYEVGIGCDIYFEFFKFSPEIKLSNSFGDVLLHQNTAFSSPINSLKMHTIMFTFYFE